MTPKERASKAHWIKIQGYWAEEGSIDGIEWIDDMIYWCKKKEPGRLDYWNEVRTEYIKIEENYDR